MSTFTLAISCLTTSNLPWFTWHSRFLCNIALYSIGPCLYHQSHPQLCIFFALAPFLHSFWSYFSTDLQLWFIDYAKAFDCMDHNKLWKILTEMGIPDHLTCLLRNLYAGQEATVRTGHGTTDWFQIRKGVQQGCILSPCLFNLYAEYIMWNATLDEAQAGIKIAMRNITSLRYADDTTLMAESKKELKSLLRKVKEESEKAGLKLNIQKKRRSWHLVPFMENRWGEVETVADFIFLGSKITVDGDCSHEIKRHLLLGRTAMTNLDSVL